MTRTAKCVSRVFVFLCVVTFSSLIATAVRAQSFVQVNSAVPASATTLGVTYTNAQVAGDINVVIVGWNDTTATVTSIADSKGNAYVLATGPLTISGSMTQSIYYAKNIVAAAAGTNTVTVTFSTTAAYPDVRIVEYSGLDTSSPLDGEAGATGTGITADSGALTTTFANDLLIGADIVTTSTAAPGTGYTQRIETAPDGDIAEDRVVTATGTYHATATLSAPGSWIMQVVVFKVAPAPSAPGNLTATAISSSQINLSWTASSESGGTISNYLVERCQAAGCTNFAQVSAQPTTSFSDTGLAASTSYSYRVRATDTTNNKGPYSNTASGTTLETGIPTPTAPGNLTALAGGTGPIVVAVHGYKYTNPLATQTTDPFDSTGGDVIVMCASSHAGVTITPSDSFGNNWISIAGPTSTTAGDDLRTEVWYARNPTVGAGHTVTMNLSVAQSLVISVIVGKGSNITSPIDAVSTIGSDGGTTTVNVQSPNITTTTSNDLLVGFAKSSTGEVWTPGIGFTAQAGASSDFLFAETGSAGVPGTYDATAGITAGATWQAAVVAVSPSATATNPNQVDLSWTASTETGGTVASYLVERCEGAGCSAFVQIGMIANIVYTDTTVLPLTSYSYRVRAVDTAGTTGPYSNIASVTTSAGGAPIITSLSPTSGTVGTAVNISGINFGSSQGSSTVSFNGTAATPTSWTSTSITAPVPTGAITGNVVVTVGGQASNGVSFTVLPPSGTTIRSGRWQFNILTGDVPAQLNLRGDTEFAVWLNADQSNGQITADDFETVDSSGCDVMVGNNIVVSSSSIDSNGNAVVKFTSNNPDATTTVTTFSGRLAGGNSITGTYTAGTPGWSCPYMPTGGNFVATFLPNLDSQTHNYQGTFTSPLFSNQTGQPQIGPDNINATLVVNSDTSDSRLTGTITISPADLTRFTTTQDASGTACLVPFPTGETLRFAGPLSNIPFGSSQVGTMFELAGYDSVGTQVGILSYSMADPNGTNGPVQPNDPPDANGETLQAAPGFYWPMNGSGQPAYFNGGIWSGTNSALYLQYGIMNGPCQAYGGFDVPFMPAVKHGKPAWAKSKPHGVLPRHDKKWQQRHHRLHHVKEDSGL